MAHSIVMKKFTKKKSSENRIPVVTYCGSLSKSKGIDLIIDAAKNDATLGEIVDSMKKVYGEWEESFGI